MGSLHLDSPLDALGPNAVRIRGAGALSFSASWALSCSASWAFAVSAVNGCGKCLKAHEHTLKQEGARDEALQDSLRIAAVVAASAAALDAASLAKSA